MKHFWERYPVIYLDFKVFCSDDDGRCNILDKYVQRAYHFVTVTLQQTGQISFTVNIQHRVG